MSSAIPPVLGVSALCAGYGGEPVLAAVDLQIVPGEWFALLGPNGSGKSTLLRCIGGLHRPQAGQVLLGGIDVWREPRRARAQLGWAHPPEALPPLLSGWQCLQVYAEAFALPAIDARTLALAEALGLGRTLLARAVGGYSLGMRQKLAALLALIGTPRLIVLDEIFNGLDPASSLVLKRHLRERVASGESAVLLATHALDIVQGYATRAVLLLDGRLARGWDAAQLAALRAVPGAFEEELARAVGGR